MSKLNFKGEIVHTEKYTDKNGEEKKKYTKAGALFEREDGSQCVKIFDTWFNVYPPRMNEDQYAQAKQAASVPEDTSDQIPFMRHEDYIGG